ncbi:helix-turn-helix transcriptional regulator [Candidatus Obscuribacterales bacterium]|nr:helix-turn-helix transcriptional regulator [Candidatus Obscuribacterales bacterium]MBX3137064.1 helix-turn-helix transcriptional regulator [Candidatus Obscuribacterales bacterium]MBX3153524.1 helix-turn-helix transcriptional regulator [Candidatus Obscuribacterales bacterium]
MNGESPHHMWCPLDYILELISGRWTVLILRKLRSGPKRPSELTRILPKISAKTLTQRLRELEDAGFLGRESFEEIPPRVVYSLTSKGEDLVCVLEALNDLGGTWQNTQGANSAQTNECKHCENLRSLEDSVALVNRGQNRRETFDSRFEKDSSVSEGGNFEMEEENSFSHFSQAMLGGNCTRNGKLPL